MTYGTARRNRGNTGLGPGASGISPVSNHDESHPAVAEVLFGSSVVAAGG
jgi:hypothetical protein